MPVIRIDCIDDPRLSAYRGLIDRPGRAGPDGFVAEGRWVVERLLDSQYEVDSVLVGSNHDVEWIEQLPPEMSVFSLPTADLSRLVGFKFHRGVLAYALHRPIRSTPISDGARRQLWIACPRIGNPQNIGSLIRSAAALGASGVILGKDSTDPFSRIAIRSSAGQIFRIPVVQPVDFRAELGRLREMGYRWIATVPSESGDADSSCESLSSNPRRSSTPIRASDYEVPQLGCLLLGPEDFGLDEYWLERADARLFIPMNAEVDSLNVATAGAILMYELCGRR